jgi:CAAX prenyl protease-like protein
VLWITVCNLSLEANLLRSVGLPEDWLGQRSGVDPFLLYPETGRRSLFLVFRFALLVITIPIAEELFLRGFFMRFADSVHWEELPLNQIGATGLLAGTAYGVLSHPSEFVAAALWFSLVTLMMVRTGKFWNCVAAHAITNLVLGIYIMRSGSWQLW